MTLQTIESKDVSLGDLFANFFVVPNFQREYVWGTDEVRQLLEDILPKNTEFEDFRVEQDFAAIGHKVLLLNARRVAQKDRHTHLILLAMEDITAIPQTGKHIGVKP